MSFNNVIAGIIGGAIALVVPMLVHDYDTVKSSPVETFTEASRPAEGACDMIRGNAEEKGYGYIELGWSSYIEVVLPAPKKNETQIIHLCDPIKGEVRNLFIDYE